MAKPIVLITGGNTGLGLATVKAFSESSNAYEIIVGSRSVQKGDDAVAAIKKEVPNTSSSLSVIQLDLASDDSIKAAADSLTTKYGKLDVLINNAGQNFDFGKEMSTREKWNTSWDVNVTGTHILTEALVPLLLKADDPRLIFMTSGTASCAETSKTEGPIYQRLNGSPDAGWPKSSDMVKAYRGVKTGLNMVALEWNRLLRNDKVKVWAISPGFLATGLGSVGADTLRKMGAKEPWEGAHFIRDVVEGKRDHDVGKAIRATEVQPW